MVALQHAQRKDDRFNIFLIFGQMVGAPCAGVAAQYLSWSKQMQFSSGCFLRLADGSEKRRGLLALPVPLETTRWINGKSATGDKIKNQIPQLNQTAMDRQQLNVIVRCSSPWPVVMLNHAVA